MKGKYTDQLVYPIKKEQIRVADSLEFQLEVCWQSKSERYLQVRKDTICCTIKQELNDSKDDWSEAVTFIEVDKTYISSLGALRSAIVQMEWIEGILSDGLNELFDIVLEEAGRCDENKAV